MSARAWRSVAQVATQWLGADQINHRLLASVARGAWWEVLRDTGVTLLVSREYEHLLMALRSTVSGNEISYLPMPHPSGIAVDRRRHAVHVASTRNPNQVFEFRLVHASDPPQDRRRRTMRAPGVLIPVRCDVYPGRLYLHDLAIVDGVLHGTAAGENALVTLAGPSAPAPVWWPRCIERNGTPTFDCNHIQLNSIAAGPSIQASYFTASGCSLSHRRPGHRNYPVNKRGALFSGATREPVVGGLTRPHSARYYKSQVWVANSGYGEVGIADTRRGVFQPITRLPGWTRGLCLVANIAFVGTSRVIPRFRQYAPGLDVERSRCGIHAVDVATGKTLGSLEWPHGNQIFAIDWISSHRAHGFPLNRHRTAAAGASRLFYSFEPVRNPAASKTERSA